MNIPVEGKGTGRKKFFLLAVGIVIVCLSFAGSSYAASQISQCANDSNNDGIIQACTWTTGALNQNNSDYAESDGVPQRWFFTHSSSGSAVVHTAVFEYDFTKNSVYAYDFLVDVDHTMPTALINPCGNLPPFVDADDCLNAFAVSDNIPIPSDTYDAVAVREHPPSRNIRFGCIEEGGNTDACTLVSVGTPVHIPDPDPDCFQNCGNSSVQITVQFTTPAVGDHLIGMWLAGELAPAFDPDGAGPKIGWGSGFGASSAPGASFHFKLIELDGQNIGGEDDQLTSLLIEQSHDADLAVTKTCPATVVAGNNISYTIQVTNNGPDTATNVFVDDTLPAGVTFVSSSISQGTCNAPVGSVVHCDIGFMQPNDTVTLSIVVNVPGGTAAGTILTDSVTVGGPFLDPDTDNNTASCSTTVQAATPPVDLSVAKTCPSPAIAGDPANLTYTLTVRNHSTTTNATSVVLTDSLPGGVTFVSSNPGGPTCTESGGVVTCNLGTINACTDSPGCDTFAVTVTITVHVDPSVRGAITNVATVAGAQTDNNTANNTSSCDTTVNGAIDLQVVKTCDPTSVAAGEQVTFQVSVSNNGPSTSLDTHIEDVITTSGVTFTFISAVPSQGSGCNFNGVDTVHCVLGDILPGGSATIDITVLINTGSAGSISDTASTHIHPPDEDTNHCNDQPPPFGGCGAPGGCLFCQCSTTVTGDPVDPVDLSVTKSDSPDPALSGDNLTYTMVVKNLSGTTNATNVVLIDTLPGNVTFFSSTPGSPTCTELIGVVTCNLGTINACTDPPDCTANAVTVTIIVTISEFFSGTLTNNVTVGGDDPDSNTDNNAASEDTTVNAPPLPPPVPIPTLNEWGMIIFMILAGLGSVYYLRRQGRV